MEFVARAPTVAAILTLLALAGCENWREFEWSTFPGFARSTEFAAPQSRWTGNLPGAAAAEEPAPPRVATYCYRTLATVDCFTTPQPERATGVTGVYPTPNSAP